jgi:hypothetical protein
VKDLVKVAAWLQPAHAQQGRRVRHLPRCKETRMRRPYAPLDPDCPEVDHFYRVPRI